jgi:hypothetical protein
MAQRRQRVGTATIGDDPHVEKHAVARFVHCLFTGNQANAGGGPAAYGGPSIIRQLSPLRSPTRNSSITPRSKAAWRLSCGWCRGQPADHDDCQFLIYWQPRGACSALSKGDVPPLLQSLVATLPGDAEYRLMTATAATIWAPRNSGAYQSATCSRAHSKFRVRNAMMQSTSSG